MNKSDDELISDDFCVAAMGKLQELYDIYKDTNISSVSLEFKQKVIQGEYVNNLTGKKVIKSAYLSGKIGVDFDQ